MVVCSRGIKNILLFLLVMCKSVSCQQRFVASFQKDIEGSFSATSDVWIEFSKKIPPFEQFTACHWIKIKFYNLKVAANLWSYCTIKDSGDKMRCLQAFMTGNLQTANRDLVFQVEIPLKNSQKFKNIKMNVKFFRHRTWTHFCWIFSGITGISKLYYDGILLQTEKINLDGLDLTIKDANNIYDVAFIFGQEPDSMRGGFDNQQAFLGDLSELNLWNYTMQDIDVLQMASCRDGRKGNIVA